MTRKLAIYDPDHKAMMQLAEMINKALPNYELECYTTISDLIHSVENDEVAVVFLDISSLMPLFNLQQIIARLRANKPRMDFVLLNKDPKLEEDTTLWLWAIKVHTSSKMMYPYKYEDLIDSLANIWYKV